MKTTSRILIILAVFYSYLLSQPYENIMISNVGAPEEVTICINPKNTSQISAGANITNFYVSTNSGFNWFRGSWFQVHTGCGRPNNNC
jgi:hypothetical protein